MLIESGMYIGLVISRFGGVVKVFELRVLKVYGGSFTVDQDALCSS